VCPHTRRVSAALVLFGLLAPVWKVREKAALKFFFIPLFQPFKTSTALAASRSPASTIAVNYMV